MSNYEDRARVIYVDLTLSATEQSVALGKPSRVFGFVIQAQVTPGDRLQLRDGGPSGEIKVDCMLDLASAGRPVFVSFPVPVWFADGIHTERIGTWGSTKELSLFVEE